nr:uncharacterized protein LOC111125143 isoform X4 [Crassostrea virginica]
MKKNETRNEYRKIVSYYQSVALYHDPDMKNRSNSISFDDSSPSAILNISEVQCKDDGRYQCIVGYINSNGIGADTRTETSVYIQVMADIPEFTIQPANTTLEKYSAVILSCSANVGRPGGIVTIWKQSHISDERIQLGNSSSSVTDTGNCSDYANLLITYNLSRSDDGFSFGCTSKNKHTNDPAPSKEEGPRTILYGEDRSYETLSSGTTPRNLEERNYESLSNGMTDTYSSIDERDLRVGEGAQYEYLGSGETHTYSSIQPTVSM